MPVDKDSYGQLDEMHKLIEELRTELIQTKSALADLRKIISAHHTKIFEKVDEGGAK